MRAHRTTLFLSLLRFSLLGITAVGVLLASGCRRSQVQDEALLAGLVAKDLPSSPDDYYGDMDYGITRQPETVAARLAPYVANITPQAAVDAVTRGRNNWIVWTAGNDRFWDEISRQSFGALDLLKTVSNHPSMSYSRDNRWRYLGLVNEPCFEKPSAARVDRHGLWLDVRQPGCGEEPFESATNYPGIKIGARGKNVEVGSYYGYATGIVGLRLFTNPAFDEKAAKKWDAEAYYTRPEYYNDKGLVKPYRVGMSCGFCHVGPNPTNPPPDPEHPEWQHLSSNPGAQYFWIDRIFFWNVDEGNYVYQMFHTSRPGALDTSLVSSDNINNPRTMNAVYNLEARLEIGRKWGQETLSGGGFDNAQFNDYVPADSPLAAFFNKPDTVWTPHVLKDGADSVGALGALNRVFVNIGLFSEEWLLHFTPLIGGRNITPFKIDVARKNSVYWQATEAQTPDLALFFLATARPDKLASAPGGEQHLQAGETTLEHGKVAFAERCARCHSSKQPEKAFTDFFSAGCVGPDYLKCWNRYWAWTKSDEYKSAVRDIVLAEDFLDNNFLSTDLRVPVTLLDTNACSPLATNGIENNIWDNFTSRSYKDLPSVGEVVVHHPLTGEKGTYSMPAGGRGYTRPASLLSLWSTAPYLLNNTVGKFYWTGSVADRMAAFEDGIGQMLWPERREGTRTYETAGGYQVPGVIDRTTVDSSLRISYGFLPDFLRGYLSWRRWLPWANKDRMALEIGPIPKGTPVNLIANLDLNAPPKKLAKLVPKLIAHLLEAKGTSGQAAADVWKPLVPDLLEVNKCPDFVVNRGHYFGTDFLDPRENEPGLSEEDKLALIEFLKTF